MPRQPQPARRPQRRRPRLTSRRQKRRRLPLLPFRRCFRLHRLPLDPGLLSLQPGRSLAPGLTSFAPFRGRGHQHRSVQPFLLATHSDRPTEDDAAAPPVGGANQSVPSAARRGDSDVTPLNASRAATTSSS